MTFSILYPKKPVLHVGSAFWFPSWRTYLVENLKFTQILWTRPLLLWDFVVVASHLQAKQHQLSALPQSRGAPALWLSSCPSSGLQQVHVLLMLETPGLDTELSDGVMPEQRSRIPPSPCCGCSQDMVVLLFDLQDLYLIGKYFLLICFKSWTWAWLFYVEIGYNIRQPH